MPLTWAAEQLGWSLKKLRREDKRSPLPFIIRRSRQRPRASRRGLHEFMDKERARVAQRL